MDRRSNGAIVGTMLLVLSATLIFGCGTADGATYTVGGDAGWTFIAGFWPNGKTFKAGDVLVFNYDPKEHNVVLVNDQGLLDCTVEPSDAPVYNSGHDHIVLKKGPNNFICSSPGNCEYGMRIAITAQ